MNELKAIYNVGDAYLSLIHPNFSEKKLLSDISKIIELSSIMNTQLISDLIVNGISWRERLIGIVLATYSGITVYVRQLVDSLYNPRGFVIVTTFAALTVAVVQQPSYMPKNLHRLDRSAFSGELGWSLDKFMFHIGHSSQEINSISPNDGQSFEKHIQLIKLIQSTQQTLSL